MNLTINIDTWSKSREISYCPKHFVSTTTPLTEESKIWVLERLHGRYHIGLNYLRNNIFDSTLSIYFEDPQEAVLYELTWS
jgi:hypothetical protein